MTVTHICLPATGRQRSMSVDVYDNGKYIILGGSYNRSIWYFFLTVDKEGLSETELSDIAELSGLIIWVNPGVVSISLESNFYDCLVACGATIDAGHELSQMTAWSLERSGIDIGTDQ